MAWNLVTRTEKDWGQHWGQHWGARMVAMKGSAKDPLKAVHWVEQKVQLKGPLRDPDLAAGKAS